MIDAHAIDCAFRQKARHKPVGIVEYFPAFYAQTRELVDVEKAPIVDLVRRDLPERRAPGLRFK
jgi:hypothetical protein